MHIRFKPKALRYAPILAGLVFGSWAACVHSEYGTFVLVRTGLGQGIYALFSTWIVTHTVADVMDFPRRNSLRFFFGFASGFIVMVSIPLAIHLALGTPEIVLAIAPGVLWGSIFIAGCVWTTGTSRPHAGEKHESI